MSNSTLRETLAAAIPVREVSQPRASELTLATSYGWTDAPAAQNQGGSESSSTITQVLQSTLKEASDSVTQANKQLLDLQTVQQQMLASTGQNTQALNANTTAKGGSGSSALSTAGNLLGDIVGGGSILTPIISGIMSLFGGGGAPAQPTFTAFTMPSPVQLETSVKGTLPAQVPAQVNPASQSNGDKGAATPSSQIQIQVNAMDSRSFLDHSNEIAEAVRQALLNSHSLSDVIAEL